MTRAYLFAASVMVSSCKQGAAPSTGQEPFKAPSIHTVYTQTVCHGSACSYVHYLMLDTYDDTKFDEYNFVNVADNYLDTVKANVPVAGIQFCTPFSFKDIGGSENDEQLRAHAITLLWYKEGDRGRLPEISSVTIWNNGRPKELHWMDRETRTRGH